VSSRSVGNIPAIDCGNPLHQTLRHSLGRRGGADLYNDIREVAADIPLFSSGARAGLVVKFACRKAPNRRQVNSVTNTANTALESASQPGIARNRALRFQNRIPAARMLVPHRG